eukprot:7746686-Pyramimonas_sp.AAC.1
MDMISRRRLSQAGWTSIPERARRGIPIPAARSDTMIVHNVNPWSFRPVLQERLLIPIRF